MRIDREFLKDGDIVWVTKMYWDEHSIPQILDVSPRQCEIKLKYRRKYDEKTDTLSDYYVDYDTSTVVDIKTKKPIGWIDGVAMFTTEDDAREYYNERIEYSLARVNKIIEKYNNIKSKIESMKL